MPAQSTLYDLLEVSPFASARVIRAAYRCLAQSSHPDKHGGAPEAIERQAQFNGAYAVLSDPVKRRRYDQTLGLQGDIRERRGQAYFRPGASRETGGAEAGSRAFIFRPLT